MIRTHFSITKQVKWLIHDNFVIYFYFLISRIVAGQRYRLLFKIGQEEQFNLRGDPVRDMLEDVSDCDLSNFH